MVARGEPTTLQREGENLAHLDPRGMEAYLLDISDGGRVWCDRVVQGCRDGERHCLRLFAEAVKWVGIQHSVALVLVQKLGVRDEVELHELVTSGKRLAQLAETPPATMLHDAEQVMRMVIQKDPACRTDARRICHTLLQVLDGLSSAEEVNGTP